MKETGTFEGWAMVAPGQPFERRSFPLPPPAPGEVTLEVAGCGVCHTDLSFLHFGVKTRAELPLVLGHEISGTVVDIGDGVERDLKGRPVLVPAVLPCGECEACRRDERRICSRQTMPGNDRHGGFATHVQVPARFVCPVEAAVLEKHELWELAVVADAVTTPFQAVRRSGLQAGDLAIFVGVGGIGIHGVQIARAAGAKVIALDVDSKKLEAAAELGAAATVEISKLDPKAIKGRVKEEAKRIGAPGILWRIFETSGTRAGQETAFSLLGFGSTLSTVGFTMDKLELRLSNLMAFDATVRGNWGCDPLLYPEVLSWVADGRIRVRSLVEKRPLKEINEVFEAARRGDLKRRAVMTP